MGLNGKSAYASNIQMLLQECEEKMTSRAFHDVAHKKADFQIFKSH